MKEVIILSFLFSLGLSFIRTSHPIKTQNDQEIFSEDIVLTNDDCKAYQAYLKKEMNEESYLTN